MELQDSVVHTPIRPAPTPTEIYSWTFTQDAVAPCFVKDIFKLRQEQQHDFFWLGRVPCRVVQIVGVVVGVQQKEHDTRYSVDDGSEVVDCVVRHPKQTTRKRRDFNIEDSYPPPLANVGALVAVQGRVTAYYETRCLKVDQDQFRVCSSFNEEPQHWKKVVDLHRTTYSGDEPFRIPPRAEPAPRLITDVDSLKGQSSSPTHDTNVCKSPEAVSSPLHAADGTAVEHKSRPEPANSAPRLRHPSHLHSGDLTDITFKIYIKHYMDNAPLSHPGINHTQSPRSTAQSSKPTNATSSQLSPCDDDINPADYGFTLAYLRRVPELAEMAVRVVLAEKKRRDRAASKKAREVQEGKVDAKSTKKVPSQVRTPASSSSSKSKEQLSPKDITSKTKRLYLKAIRDLYSEGSIIVWSGPKRKIGVRNFDIGQEGHDSLLWKFSSSRMTQIDHHLDATQLTNLSTLTVSSVADTGWTLDDLSDASPDEECYVPVTTQRVAPLVKDAIRALTSRNRPADSTRNLRSKSQPGASISPTKHSSEPAPLPSKRRQFYNIQNTINTKPTTMDILSYIRSSDSTWANLAEWVVEQSLEELLQVQWVFKAGDGRWDLSL